VVRLSLNWLRNWQKSISQLGIKSAAMALRVDR
jgi:hypothetical protein